ncbi:hypothetical protein HOP50_01g08880 [Chloropicon primus]|uniref:Calponin-homology (CH) domain-containing protein n=1 Tax=Chloropicon primus TaxID=1764295 RepID=A0A5B8MD97_9CHLO|nr:hypothetical protein A3770_01p09010 [Chloropicon primus]UPQ97593.1 hypothetical protein HOP50_01g08880 [Chloropicon primus]|eukprot:QDZ18383.1 hypothetical protein A3770_01p09010 [Chloropicon primus]
MASPSKAKRVEEKYLAERTLVWLGGLTKQNLADLNLALGDLLRNGKVLKRVALSVEIKAVVGSGKSKEVAAPFSVEDLTGERKGFAGVLDIEYFLKTCRSLGLKDTQLFNASDVTTEGGNLLRVCRTIRSLSLSCQEKGIVAPVFETGKQAVEARRRSMSREVTSSKVTKLLGLEKASEGGKASERKRPVAALYGLAVGLVVAVACRILGPRKGAALGPSMTFHF